MKHILSLARLGQDDFLHLIDRGCEFAADPNPLKRPLAGATVGLEFRKTSTRTRTSFAVGAIRLGAIPIIYGPNDLQTNTGETLEDSVRVLGKYLNVLVVRSAADPSELERMSRLEVLPIINAMTADEHPTQALCDLSMMKRHFARLSGVRLLYSGEGNNTAVALAYAVSRVSGMHADFRTPEGYGLPPEVIERAQRLAKRFQGTVSHSHEPPSSADRGCADVVYATRWQTTGSSQKPAGWRDRFAPFRITEALMAAAARGEDSIFMHDLPAVRDEDCDSVVLDGPRSIAFLQAEQKLFTAMAAVEWCADN